MGGRRRPGAVTGRAIFLAAMLLAGGAMLAPPATALDSWVKMDMGKGYDANAQGGLYGVAIGDGDRDGEIEVYASCYDNGHIYEYRREGLRWSVKDLGVLWPGRNPRADAVLVGDGDDDGLTEVYANGYLYTTSSLVNSVYQLVNGTGGWTKTDIGASGGWGMDITMGDGNRDGRTELYSSDADGHIYQYSKVNAWNVQDIGGSPPFYFNKNYINPYMRGVEVGDADNDGRDEVYGASSDGHVYRYNRTGAGWERTDLGGTENGSFPLYGLLGLTIGDADNDGENEIYAPSYFNATIWRFKFDGKTGIWNVSRLPSLVPGGTANDICIGDGNSDGRNELYVGTSNKQLYQLVLEGGSWKSDSVGSGGGAINGVAVGSTTKDTSVRQLIVASGDGHCYEYIQDRVAPANPELWSDTHPVPGTWYNDRRVHILWKDTGFDISGIDGYSTVWDGLSDTLPYAFVTSEESTHDLFTTLEDGRWYFHIRTGDNLQNWNDSAVHYGPVLIDTTSPDSMRLAIEGGADLTGSSLVTLSVEASDHSPGSGIASMAFSNDGRNWSEWEPFCATRAGWDLSDPLFGGNGSDGTKTVLAKVKDGVGREIPADRRARSTILLDRTAPGNLSLSINGGAGSTSSAEVELRVEAFDPGAGSGLARMAFSNDGLAWGDWMDWRDRTRWSLTWGAGGCATDGPKSVHFRAQDRAGNIGGPASATIMLDTGRPFGLRLTINGGAGSTNVSVVSLGIESWDPEPGSPPMEMAISNSEEVLGRWEPYSPAKPAWSLCFGPGGTDTDGEKTVWLRVRDGAGNLGGPVNATVFLDRIRPGPLGLKINSGASTANRPGLMLALEARDTAPSSGIELMQFSDDGETWGDWEPYSPIRLYNLSGADGPMTVHFRVKDRAGNIAESAVASILLDTTPPVIYDISVFAISNGSATVSWKTDGLSIGRVVFSCGTGPELCRTSERMAPNHTVRLDGLLSNTTYRFRVWSADGLLNNATSQERNFTTLEAYTPPPPRPRPVPAPEKGPGWAWLAAPLLVAGVVAGMIAFARSGRRKAPGPDVGARPEGADRGPPEAMRAAVAETGWEEDPETISMDDDIPTAVAEAVGPDPVPGVAGSAILAPRAPEPPGSRAQDRTGEIAKIRWN